MFGFVLIKGKWISRLLSALCALIVFLAGIIFPPTFYPLDEEELLLNFSVIADTHITESVFDERSLLLIDGLHDMARGAAGSDALVVSGDLTEQGLEKEYDSLFTILDKFCGSDNLVLASGNHEFYGGEYDEQSARFADYMSRYVLKLDKTYYSTRIKGFTFIVLGTEAYPPNGVEAYLSDEQLDWFDAELDAAAQDGKPVFVLCHQPLAGTCRVDESWPPGVLGAQSDRVYALLKEHDGEVDIFFISGHLHSGLGFSGVTNDGSVYFVDTPSFGKGNGPGYPETGTGYQVELYGDEIVFRARSFTEGEWLTEYDETIPLTKEVAR